MTKVKIKNRSSGTAGYLLPEYKDRVNVLRQFAPGEIKEIDKDELEALMYAPGGETMLKDYLQVLDEEVIQEINLNVEPEYNMSEADVIELMQNGSLDAFLDCLDFAPEGIKDIIKEKSVSLPLNDVEKRAAIKRVLGFDVDRAILNERLDKEEENASEEETKTRRVKTTNKTEGRRTTPKYKIVND